MGFGGTGRCFGCRRILLNTHDGKRCDRILETSFHISICNFTYYKGEGSLRKPLIELQVKVHGKNAHFAEKKCLENPVGKKASQLSS